MCPYRSSAPQYLEHASHATDTPTRNENLSTLSGFQSQGKMTCIRTRRNYALISDPSVIGQGLHALAAVGKGSSVTAIPMTFSAIRVSQPQRLCSAISGHRSSMRMHAAVPFQRRTKRLYIPHHGSNQMYRCLEICTGTSTPE